MGFSWIEGSTEKGYVCMNRADFTQAFKFSGIKENGACGNCSTPGLHGPGEGNLRAGVDIIPPLRRGRIQESIK